MRTAKPKSDVVPVVELIRTSTDRQDTSRQRMSLDKCRESRPGHVVERFEIAFTATKSLAEQGAQAQRLIALAQAKAFGELRVSCYDRLFGARSFDPRIQAEILGLCLDAGAILVEADGNSEIKPGTFEGNLIAAFKGGLSAEDRVRLLAKTNQGRVQAAIDGRAPNGRPYGRRYNSDPLFRRWEYDPIEEPILRELISWVMSGWTIGAVVRELNRLRVLVESLVEQLRDGAKLDRLLDKLDDRDELLVRILRSDRVAELLVSGADPIAVVDRCFLPLLGGGKPERRDGKRKTNRWWERTISGLLSQRHLVGDRTYTNKHRPGWLGTYQVPPILTEAEFQRLQDKLDRRTRKGRPGTKHNAICQGRIYCACGRRVQVKVSGRGRHTYFCSSGHSQHLDRGGERCPYFQHRDVTIVDNAAWSAITAYLDGDRSVFADAASDAPDLAPHRDEVAQLQSDIAALKKREANMARTYASGGMTDATWSIMQPKITGDLKALTAREREAKAVLARLEASQASHASLAAAIDQARARVRSASVSDRKAIVQELIPDEVGHGIYLGADGHVEIVLGLLAPEDEGTGSGGGSRTARRGAKACSSARRATCRRSSRAARRATAARTSTRSAASCT